MRIALIDWSQLIEDYLDNIGISFEQFCGEMSGGWMFGYIAALKTANVDTILFCVSARVSKPEQFTHKATGATICVLPAPAIYKLIRRRIVNPYAESVMEAVGDARGLRRLLLWTMKNAAPYLSTPIVRLRRELRRERCEAILCQDYEHERFDVCALLCRGVMRLPIFATFQGGDLAPRDPLRRCLRRWSVNTSAGLIVASRAEVSRVRSRYDIPARRIARVFNPLDLSLWRPHDREAARSSLRIPAGALVAAWHGRVIINRKGLDVLLRACEIVTRDYAGAGELRLLLVGDGHDRDALREMIARSPARHSIIWNNEFVVDRTRLRTSLSVADVYMFSSREEGFPVAPIEAMACGLPVVAARANGVEDIFEHGEESGGIVVERGDAAALARGVLRLFDNQELRHQMGENARKRARDGFSLEAVGAQLAAVLRRTHAV